MTICILQQKSCSRRFPLQWLDRPVEARTQSELSLMGQALRHGYRAGRLVTLDTDPDRLLVPFQLGFKSLPLITQPDGLGIK